MIHHIDNMRDGLGFKRIIIEREIAGSISGVELIIFADYPFGFSSDNCIFLYASFVKISRVVNTNIPLLRVLES